MWARPTHTTNFAMPLGLLDGLVPVVCLSLSFFLYRCAPLARKEKQRARPRGYLLYNQVTHARLLPQESAHAFTYPTNALLVSLDALEQGQLDLCRGWVFGYGNTWGRLTGLRSAPYLSPGSISIKGKLENVLRERGYVVENFQDAWMMTMPSFMGFEGINPLTVYFCYHQNGRLWLTVLEIHNTFGESHVHVLEVGQNEDEIPSQGYDHQWTFSRQFHVSPFNDRSGFYTVSIRAPSHPPTASYNNITHPPKPSVRVHQYTASEKDPTQRGTLKLTALLRPTHAELLATSSLLLALARAPFALLLTFPRILYVAWVLHYVKRLDVYLRPDPIPATGGVKWLDEGFIERFARKQVEEFLRWRSEETGTTIVLVSADPHIPRLVFEPRQEASTSLTVWYISPRFFSVLFLSPSAKHALLLGCDTENLFNVSDRDLFLSVFSFSGGNVNPRWPQRLRCRPIPSSLNLPVPNAHYLDQTHPGLMTWTMIIASHALGCVEKWIFSLARARVVEDQEPWKQWDRAAAKHVGIASPFVGRNSVGSVRRGG